MDVANESLIVEITGTEDKIEGLVEVLRPFGIIEMVRTGLVSMARGQPNGNGSGPLKSKTAPRVDDASAVAMSV